MVVSIRARQLRRANPSYADFRRIGIKFQSAPANYGGRILYLVQRARARESFNPRPPITAGESHRRHAAGQRDPVSIRARQLRRANLLAIPNGLAASSKFQSAPANYGGRISRRLAGWDGRRCFNPRPPITAGESGNYRIWNGLGICFNPRPPITAGESVITITGYDVYKVFQSAPANYGGRIPQKRAQLQAIEQVSIRARQLRRANHGDRGRVDAARAVSIRARQLRRANRAQRGAQCGRFRFQSAPANYGGRILILSGKSGKPISFNPRPPITAGESYQ